ncbi:MAG: alkaline phosphatase family protein [Clostridia bacterium]|nr:alkaline phosphatase family protein [Clostridia bacterium]
MKKKLFKIISVLMASVLIFTCFTACKKDDTPPSDKEYLNRVSSYSFWQNSKEQAIPIYNTYNHIHKFLDECEIKDGKAVASNGKIRKVLFLGFDGMRAEALSYILNDDNGKTTANNSVTNVGAFNRIKYMGGIYLAYCGGETGTDSEQTTSTAASWTTHFTGVWGNKHGIKTNDDSKNMDYKTFMLEYAEKGLNSALAFDWDQYLDVNVKEEVKYVMQNNLPMTFCDIDRAKADKLKKTRAETLELYNFVAPDSPSDCAPFDSGMRDYVLDRMEKDDDVIAAIFHNVDTAGHNYGYGTSTEYKAAVVNVDLYANSILNAIEEREKNNNEEWLIVFANDHGGIGQGHGEQTYEERTNWIASNVKFDESLYGKNYDGFNEHK